MALTEKEIRKLLRLVRLTRDEEIGCNQCLRRAAEFAERALEGKTVSEGLEAVEHHLRVCQDCREEYELLRKALESLDD